MSVCLCVVCVALRSMWIRVHISFFITMICFILFKINLNNKNKKKREKQRHQYYICIIIII